MTIEQINAEILQIQGPRGAISDGYHTFDMLYEMRMALSAAFFNALQEGFDVVKSWNHADGEKCFGGGWFIIQAKLPAGQISFHYPEKYWDNFKIPEVNTPDQWDGHTEDDVINRLLAF